MVVSMNKHTVLIVEDERIIAESFKLTLESNHYQVIGICKRKRQAIELVKEHYPDIVLMDINLGSSESGIEIAEAINRIVNIPVIFITAYADTDTVSNASNSFPYGYLVKPIIEKELLATVQIALKKFAHEQKSKVFLPIDSSDGSVISDIDLFPEFELMDNLTSKETIVLTEIGRGYTDSEIAETLHLSVLTIKTHKRNITAKLSIKNTTRLVAVAARYCLMN